MKSAKREASSLGRCIAISSLAMYIYCQLTHATRHAKVKDAIIVLLAVLKVSPPIQQTVSSTAIVTCRGFVYPARSAWSVDCFCP